MHGDEIELRITDIVRDPDYQVRQKLKDQAVAQYANAYASGQVLPPVKVALVDGLAILTDGWHRLAALDRLGRATVLAQVENMTEREARWRAAEANLTHGVQLTRPEHREVFRAFVRSGRHREGSRFKSYREIASELGGLRAHTTLRLWMRSDFPKVYRAMAGEDEGENEAFEPPLVDREEHLERLIMGHVDEVRAIARGMKDAGRRGEIVRALEELLRDVREARAWTPSNDDF